MEHAKTTDLSF